MFVFIALIPFMLMMALWRGRIRDWRDRFLAASVVWGFVVVAITEVLSVFDGIATRNLVIAWVVTAAIVVVITPFIPHVQKANEEFVPLNGLQKLLMIGVGLIVAVSALVAWIGPPNNWDSMTYHLARVVHWMQNGNVDFYPAATANQLELSPGAEYVVLHLNSLVGTDRLANLVQWFAFVGCMVGVSNIARHLGLSRWGQMMAVAFAATLPSACLEAVTTQNDLVGAFWLVCSIWLILRIRSDVDSPARTRLFMATLCGSSMGLAFFTKATMYIYIAPFVLGWFGLSLARADWKAAGSLALAGIVALVLNFPLCARNYRFTHTLLGNPESRLPYVNARFGIRPTVSNLIRNTAMELVSPWRLARDLDEKVARWVDGRLGIDPEDPSSTWTGMHFHLSRHMWNDEDTAGNPLHVLLLLCAIAVFPFVRRRGDLELLLYVAAIVLGFIGFCAYLRFQVFHTRLLMPLLVIAGPFVAAVLGRRFGERSLEIGTGVLIAAAFACIVSNHLHPFVGRHSIFTASRTSLYFVSRPSLEEPYRAIARRVAEVRCREVGLIIGANDFEYPLDVLIKQVDPAIRIEVFPSAVSLDPKTRNRGWRDDLYPRLVVSVHGGSVSEAESLHVPG